MQQNTKGWDLLFAKIDCFLTWRFYSTVLMAVVSRNRKCIARLCQAGIQFFSILFLTLREPDAFGSPPRQVKATELHPSPPGDLRRSLVGCNSGLPRSLSRPILKKDEESRDKTVRGFLSLRRSWKHTLTSLGPTKRSFTFSIPFGLGHAASALHRKPTRRSKGPKIQTAPPNPATRVLLRAVAMGGRRRGCPDRLCLQVSQGGAEKTFFIFVCN